MSLPIVWAAIALAAGVATGQALAVPLWAAVVIALVTLVLAVAAYWRSREHGTQGESGQERVTSGGRIVLAAVAASGLFLMTLSHNLAIVNLRPWIGKTVVLVGTVVDEPQINGREISYILRTEWIRFASTPSRDLTNSSNGPPVKVPGMVEVTGRASTHRDSGSVEGAGTEGLMERFGRPPDSQQTDSRTSGRILAFGDRVSLMGQLSWPVGPSKPGGFDPRANLARRGIALIFKTRGTWTYLESGEVSPIAFLALRSRRSLESVIDRTLPEPHGPLLAGLIFGSRSQLPQEIKDDFRKTGVFHILAVSGSNVALVAFPFLWVFGRLGLSRGRAALLTIPVVVFYALLTGAGPSVMRASAMATVGLLALALYRRPDPYASLGVAGLLIVLANPRALFDVGLQLSFAATWGIIAMYRPIQQRLSFLPGILASTLGVTLAAQMAVTPIGLYYFGGVSVISLIANLFVVPLVAILVNTGSAVTLIGLIYLPAAQVLSHFNHILLTILIRGVKWFAGVPFGYLELPRWPITWVIIYYLALGAFMGWWNTARLLSSVATCLRARRLVRFLVLALPAVVAGWVWWRAVVVDLPGTMTIDFINVGQGDAALVRFPGGKTLLIDGGGAPDDSLDVGKRVVVPFLKRKGVREIDYLLLSHPDQDHVGGLAAVVRAFPIGLILENGREGNNPGYQAFVGEAERRGIRRQSLSRFDTVAFAPGIRGIVLSPDLNAGPATRQPNGSRAGPGGELASGDAGSKNRRNGGEASEGNNASVVLKLIYGEVSLLFTGDLEAGGEKELVEAAAESLDSDLLKVSHHGSGGSSTDDFLRAVSPQWAVISVGPNPFGHPNPSALARIGGHDATILRTDRLGSIRITTDGYKLKARTSALSRIWRRWPGP